MVKATRKKSLSIPQLRHAFDHIDTWVESHLARHTGPVKDLVPDFQKEWKKTFKRDVDAKSAEAYLQLKKSHPPRMTRKHKKKFQHGGAQLAGAPLDYMTRQGVYGVYGHFPTYVSSGLSAYNQFNNDSIVADCPKPSFTEKIPAGMGSNQVGGTTRKKGFRHKKTRKNGQRGGASLIPAPIMAAFERPINVASPPSTLAIVQQELRGQNIATPHPTSYTAPQQPYTTDTLPNLTALPKLSISSSGVTYGTS
jgi:hypothetical protein